MDKYISQTFWWGRLYPKAAILKLLSHKISVAMHSHIIFILLQTSSVSDIWSKCQRYDIVSKYNYSRLYSFQSSPIWVSQSHKQKIIQIFGRSVSQSEGQLMTLAISREIALIWSHIIWHALKHHTKLLNFSWIQNIVTFCCVWCQVFELSQQTECWVIICFGWK